MKNKEGHIPAYTPRWIYLFFHWIESLPIPGWLFGTIVGLLGILASHLDAWRQGLVSAGTITLELASVPLFLVGIPALWQYLNASAIAALEGFLENQSGGPYQRTALLKDFLSIPSWAATVLFIAGVFLGYSNYLMVSSSYAPIVGEVLPWLSVLSFTTAGGLILLIFLRAVRQGILMRKLYVRVNLSIFNPAPIYSLSRFAAQSVLVILLMIYGLVLTTPRAIELMVTPTFVLGQVPMIGSMVFLFFAQLAGINKRMRLEKDRVLSEIGVNLEAVNAKINKAVKQGKYAAVGQLRTSALALKENWDLVKRISTWPWEPETLRNVLLPFLVPVIVYLLQRFAGTIFGI